MRKFTATVSTLILLASPAWAISRVDTRGRSCAAIQALIAKERAVILRYPSRDGRTTLYDRYVSSASQCGPGYYAERTYIPATDGSCPVSNCESSTDLAP